MSTWWVKCGWLRSLGTLTPWRVLMIEVDELWIRVSKFAQTSRRLFVLDLGFWLPMTIVAATVRELGMINTRIYISICFLLHS